MLTFIFANYINRSFNPIDSNHMIIGPKMSHYFHVVFSLRFLHSLHRKREAVCDKKRSLFPVLALTLTKFFLNGLGLPRKINGNLFWLVLSPNCLNSYLSYLMLIESDLQIVKNLVWIPGINYPPMYCPDSYLMPHKMSHDLTKNTSWCFWSFKFNHTCEILLAALNS